MNIVHCITGLTADGAQRMLLRLAEKLQDRGISNVVINLSKRDYLADAFEARGIPVYSLGMRGSTPSPLALVRCRRIVSRLSPTVLQGWMYHANLFLSTLRPALRQRVPLVWNIRRGMDDFTERKFLTRSVIRANAYLSSSPQSIVYCTQEARTQHERFGFIRARGQVLGNGFDTEKFAPRPDSRADIRHRLGVSDDEILIGNVGRYDSAKGRGFLLEGFASVLKVYPQARLLLVGRGVTTDNEELMSNISAAGIAHRVLLLGEFSPIAELYPAIDVMCSSSVAEGFPNVVGEAMACGVPCVATDTGNTGELLEGVGIVVPPRSSIDLASGLIAMCSEGRDHWRERGRLARERIIRSFSLDRVVEQYVSMYRRLPQEVALQGCEGH